MRSDRGRRPAVGTRIWLGALFLIQGMWCITPCGADSHSSYPGRLYFDVQADLSGPVSDLSERVESVGASLGWHPFHHLSEGNPGFAVELTFEKVRQAEQANVLTASIVLGPAQLHGNGVYLRLGGGKTWEKDEEGTGGEIAAGLKYRIAEKVFLRPELGFGVWSGNAAGIGLVSLSLRLETYLAR